MRQPHFPKLWAAFADESAVLAKLDKGLSFENLFEASRQLAVHGKSAARGAIIGNAAPRDQLGAQHSGIDKATLFESYAEWQRSRLQ